jgi:transcription initiation factor IIF auxiliary subunit
MSIDESKTVYAIKKVLYEQHLTYSEAARMLREVAFELSVEKDQQYISPDTDQ